MTDRSEMLTKISQDKCASARTMQQVLGHLEELATETDLPELALLIGVAHIAAADAATSVQRPPAELTLVHGSGISGG